MCGCWYMAFVYSMMAWAVTIALGIQRVTGTVWPRVISKGFNNHATTPWVLKNNMRPSAMMIMMLTFIEPFVWTYMTVNYGT